MNGQPCISVSAGYHRALKAKSRRTGTPMRQLVEARIYALAGGPVPVPVPAASKRARILELLDLRWGAQAIARQVGTTTGYVREVRAGTVDWRVLVAIPTDGWATREEIATRSGLDIVTASASIAALVARGDVRASVRATCWQRVSGKDGS